MGGSITSYTLTAREARSKGLLLPRYPYNETTKIQPYRSLSNSLRTYGYDPLALTIIDIFKYNQIIQERNNKHVPPHLPTSTSTRYYKKYLNPEDVYKLKLLINPKTNKPYTELKDIYTIVNDLSNKKDTHKTFIYPVITQQEVNIYNKYATHTYTTKYLPRILKQQAEQIDQTPPELPQPQQTIPSPYDYQHLLTSYKTASPHLST